MDDGSTDATPDIAAAFGPPVRLVRQATAGPAATRNTGIRQARGGLLAFLDADDRWHPEKLARQLAHLEARPDLAVCVAMVQNQWEPEQNAEYLRLQGHRRTRPVPGYITGTMLARRRAFERTGLFDETLWFADGPQWFMRAEAIGISAALLPDVLLYHRMHDGNISRRRARDSKKEFLDLARLRLQDRARCRGLPDGQTGGEPAGSQPAPAGTAPGDATTGSAANAGAGAPPSISPPGCGRRNPS